jgi:hypothetical protein
MSRRGDDGQQAAQGGRTIYRLLISGWREMSDYDLLRDTLDRVLAPHLPDVVVIHGSARGADSLADRYADERGLLKLPFRAEWHKYGRSAGHRRNTRMLVEGRPDYLVAFQHPTGKGTQDMIEQARDGGIPMTVVELPE